MADVPDDYWCNIPELHNLTQGQRKKLGIPQVNDTYSKCSRYAVNWTELLLNETESEGIEPNSSWPQETCKDGWEYDLKETISSIVIDVS